MSAAPAPASLYERAAALVELLFDAPAEASTWQKLLAALRREISEDAVAIAVGQLTPGSLPVLIGEDIEMRRLGAEILEISTQHPSPRELPAGAILPIPPASPGFARTALFRDVLRSEGLAPGPGLALVLGRTATRLTGAVLVLPRDPVAWQPKPEDRSLLELLAPYLVHAVQLGLRLNAQRSEIEAMLGVFDALVLGVVLLDDRSEVSFANQAAARLLRTSAGLSPAEPAGAAERRRRTEALRALLRREAGEADAGGERPLHIVSTPLRSSGPEPPQDRRFVSALFLGDPGLGAAGAEAALAALYGLTPAEERLALRLAAGETLTEAAEGLDIRLSTARSVLRSVFEKTGTHRQAALVRLVLTLVGQVRLEAPRG